MDFDLKSMFYDTSLTFLFFYYLHGISFSVDISIAIECIISVVIKSIINSHIHWFVCVCLVTQICLTLCDPTDCSPPSSSVHGRSPGKNTEVGCFPLLQGIFPTQGLNPGLLNCRWILYSLNHQESLKILEWIVYPFSRGSSQPRNRTRVSCIAGGFFTSWNWLPTIPKV